MKRYWFHLVSLTANPTLENKDFQTPYVSMTAAGRHIRGWRTPPSASPSRNPTQGT